MLTKKYPSRNDKRKRKIERKKKIKPLEGSLQKLWEKAKQSDVPIEKYDSEMVEKEVSLAKKPE